MMHPFDGKGGCRLQSPGHYTLRRNTGDWWVTEYALVSWWHRVP